MVLSLGAPEVHYAYYLLGEVGLPFICPKPIWLRLRREPLCPCPCNGHLMARVLLLTSFELLAALSLHLSMLFVHLYPIMTPCACSCAHQRPPNWVCTFWVGNPGGLRAASFSPVSNPPPSPDLGHPHAHPSALGCVLGYPSGPSPILPGRASCLSDKPLALSFQLASQGLMPSGQLCGDLCPHPGCPSSPH